jgi:hypothetical protein
MSEKPLMLFVWPDFMPDYKSGLAFAVAESADQAQDLIALAKGYWPECWGTCVVYPLNQRVAYAVSGGM